MAALMEGMQEPELDYSDDENEFGENAPFESGLGLTFGSPRYRPTSESRTSRSTGIEEPFKSGLGLGFESFAGYDLDTGTHPLISYGQSTPASVSMTKQKSLKKSRLGQIFSTEDWCSVWVGLFSFGASSFAWSLGVKNAPMPISWVYDPLGGLAGETGDWYPIWGSLISSTIQMMVSCFAMWCCGHLKNTRVILDYALGFYVCYCISLVSMTIGKQHTLELYGIAYAVWSLLLGMIVTNFISPCFPAVGRVLAPISGSAEFFVKVALVNIASDFSVVEDLVTCGLLTTWIKIPLSLITGWYLGTRVFQIESRELIILCCIAFTISGTSAPAAVGIAIGSSREDVNIVITLSSLVTIPFMLAVPYLSKGMGLSDEVAGGWIGAGVDNTGNVVVSGAMVSPEAETIAGITKILQTIAMGPVCLVIAYFWNISSGREKPSAWLIYDKFPKFVLGFLAVCFLVTFVAKPSIKEPTAMDNLIRVVKGMERWWAIMGFTAIGLNSDLKKMSKRLNNGRSLIGLYLVGGTVDLLVALGLAAVWYSGLILPAPDMGFGEVE
jgi:uncharacterized membrane protein YadS